MPHQSHPAERTSLGTNAEAHLLSNTVSAKLLPKASRWGMQLHLVLNSKALRWDRTRSHPTAGSCKQQDTSVCHCWQKEASHQQEPAVGLLVFGNSVKMHPRQVGHQRGFWKKETVGKKLTENLCQASETGVRGQRTLRTGGEKNQIKEAVRTAWVITKKWCFVMWSKALRHRCHINNY